MNEKSLAPVETEALLRPAGPGPLPVPVSRFREPARAPIPLTGRPPGPPAGVTARPRQSPFIQPYDGAAAGLVCNRFYRLILSNGCPFNCRYCYLPLMLGRSRGPVVFSNPWPEVERQLDRIPAGVFSTGELADSLAVTPPLLPPALEYFRRHPQKFLFLTTKSTNIDGLLELRPTPQVWIAFSLNALKAWELFEPLSPHPEARLAAARRLTEAGWRVRIRIDPVIPEVGIGHYREVARQVRALAPERVTVGVLKYFPRRPRGSGAGPWRQLAQAPQGLQRYPLDLKARIFDSLASWLGFQPAICRETPALWEALRWQNHGCNCVPGMP